MTDNVNTEQVQTDTVTATGDSEAAANGRPNNVEGGDNGTGSISEEPSNTPENPQEPRAAGTIKWYALSTRRLLGDHSDILESRDGEKYFSILGAKIEWKDEEQLKNILDLLGGSVDE